MVFNRKIQGLFYHVVKIPIQNNNFFIVKYLKNNKNDKKTTWTKITK